MKISRISFALSGTDILPKEISRLTGITPTVELARGERNKERDLPRVNRWALESQLPSDKVADHWLELAPELNKSRDVIKEIARGGRAKFTIVIESEHRLPSIIIPASMAEFAGFVNAVIDVDHLQ